jgi:hypothetical protein
VARSCKNINETLGSIKDMKFLDRLNDYQLLKKGSAVAASMRASCCRLLLGVARTRLATGPATASCGLEVINYVPSCDLSPQLVLRVKWTPSDQPAGRHLLGTTDVPRHIDPGLNLTSELGK